MSNPSAASTLTLSGSTGSRTWTATAAMQDTAAGAAVTITLATSTSGLTPPAQETSYSLSMAIDNTATVVRTFTSGIGAGIVSFSFTVDGTTATAIRAGLLRMVIAVVCSGQALAANDYNGNSDSGGTPPTGFTFTTTNSGYIRGTTTIGTALNQATYAYGDTITATTTLGAAPFQSETVSVKLGSLAAVTSAASATATFTTAQGTADNRLAASSNTDATVTTIPNAALVAVPWTTGTVTDTSATFDPRLTFTHLHQDNDNTFGTPPASKDVGAQRLSSNLAFLDSRVTNAAGVGINGITWTASLQDAGAFITAETRSVTSATEGGQAGWGSSFLSWSDQLPTGTWNKTCTITAPSGATGLEVNKTFAYQLVASNPNFRMLIGGGPATTATDARHFTPGVPLLVGLVVFDIQTGTTLALDTNPVPSAAIGRFNLTYGRAEYLTSDGVTWAAATGGTVYYWPMTVSPGDPNAWTVSITSTSTWSDADLFVVGKCTIGGVPVASFMKEIVVNGINNHDKYAFDGPGFLGFPTR